MERRFQPGQGLIILAAAILVLAGAQAIKAILVPVVLGLFLAVIGAPALRYLRRWHVPHALAVMLVVLGILGVVTVLVSIVGASATNFTQSLPTYEARLKAEVGLLFDWMRTLGITESELAPYKQINPGTAMSIATQVFNSVGNLLANSLVIVLTLAFALFESNHFITKLRVAFGYDNRTSRRLNLMAKRLQRYLAIKSVISLATGVTVAVALAIQGVDFPILWGMLAFLLNYIPTIGSIIAAIPVIAFAWVQLGLPDAFLTLGIFLTINIIYGNIIEPRILGMGLGLSTLVVFLSLLFWGFILGPVGMLLAAPLTMVLKIALESFPETRWIAIMLGSERDVERLARQQGLSG